jgi:hypothetical protein
MAVLGTGTFSGKESLNFLLFLLTKKVKGVILRGIGGEREFHLSDKL